MEAPVGKKLLHSIQERKKMKPKTPTLDFDPKNLKPGESLSDAFFRLQVEYLRSKISPKIFSKGKKSVSGAEK
jgi:hypothetical protein